MTSISAQQLERFLAVKTADGLAHAVYGVPYKTLSRIIYPSTKYREFVIKKKNGTNRIIAAPTRKLHAIQSRLASLITQASTTKPSAHGFVEGRSILTNALKHCGKRKSFVFNIDLINFFPSITFSRVRGLFMAGPFSFPPTVATVLAHICCLNGKLPQGAPTSPIISNLICRGLDGDLQSLAHECRATYTRYADDITFSFTTRAMKDLPDRIVRTNGSVYHVGDSLQDIVQKHSFTIHPDKVRLKGRSNRMEVTGLTVNEFPNVKRVLIDQIRGGLHSWEKFGFSATDVEFQVNKNYARQTRTKEKPRFDRMIWGKLLFVKMIKGKLDPVYVKLARKYNYLSKRDEQLVAPKPRPLPTPYSVINSFDLKSAVFVVHCEDIINSVDSQGTCFCLEGVGIVTCAHVVAHPLTDIMSNKYIYFGDSGHGEIRLQEPNSTVIAKLKIAYLNLAADIAILTPCSESNLQLLNLLPRTDPPKVNDTVTLVGFPSHRPTKSMTMDIGSVLVSYLLIRMHKFFHIKQVVQKGNSGGPVVDQNFQALGVAVEGATQSGGENAILYISEVINLYKKFKQDGVTNHSQ